MSLSQQTQQLIDQAVSDRDQARQSLQQAVDKDGAVTRAQADSAAAHKQSAQLAQAAVESAHAAIDALTQELAAAQAGTTTSAAPAADEEGDDAAAEEEPPAAARRSKRPGR